MEPVETVTVEVPFTIRKRGGRKQVITPDGASAWVSPRTRIDSTMIKAIARGFRWRKLLETGVYGTIEEIAAAEKINSSYVSRLLRMTLFAPDIVDAILDGRQPTEMTLAVAMGPVALAWREQMLRIGTVYGGCTIATGQATLGHSASSAMIRRIPKQR